MKRRHLSAIVASRRWLICIQIFCLLALAACCARAETPSLASQYIRTDFTIEDGLPDNTVDSIIQTDNGLLWVGTESGLASFDGRTFTPVQLRIPGVASTGAINALAIGPEGDLWIGSDASIVRIPKRELNDPYLAFATAYRVGKGQSDETQALFQARDGTMWAGTSHGLYRFDGSQFTPVLSSVYVSRIEQALDGRLLLISGNGLVVYDGSRASQQPGLGARLGVKDNQIFDALEDAQGTMWYGTNKGIRRTGPLSSPQLSPSAPVHTATFRMYVDAHGGLWACTGIGLYRISGNHLQSPAPGLNPHAFYVGRDGDLWIGTNGSGLTHLHPRQVHMYTRADGLMSDIAMAVLPTQDGRLWVGTNCGLAVSEGNRFRPLSERDGLANSCVWTLAEDHQHNLWIGTYGGGIFRYRDHRFTQYTMEQGLPSRIVFQIKVARDDSLWIATPDGLSHMKDGKFRNYTSADGLASNRILDIHQDHAGTIWIATQNALDRFDGSRFVALPTGPAEVLPRHLVEDAQGHLYTTDMPRGISRIGTDQLSLLDSTLDLMEMAEAPDHHLWFSSRNGVVRIAAQELAQAGTSKGPLNYGLFDRADGLLTTEASVGSPNIAMTPDGKLWIATVKGLAMIDTTRLPPAGRKPAIFVAGLLTDGSRSRVRDGFVLAPGIHRVELHLAAVDLATPRKVRLQYRMEGVDPEWLDLDLARTAVYTNIPLGTHRLLVRSTDSIGNWDRGQAIYQVTQTPDFYQTTLFQITAIFALLALLVAAYVLRVRYLVRQTRILLEERQVERESVARDLHDTFLQGIHGLILRFHTGTQQLPPEQPERRIFEEALRQSDKVMLEGRSVLSRLRSSRTTSEALPHAFASIANDLGSLTPAHFEVIVTGLTRDIQAIVQEQLLKIGREALFNAFSHARASTIEAEMHFGIFELRLRFRDDGIGIDPAILRQGSVAGHYGLPGMRERVKSIGGQMDLWSRPGAGTELEVRIPAAIAYQPSGPKYSIGSIRRLWRVKSL
jgi:ligand-binding sensor domain-containing protein/signal transduction histidine kinase